MVVDPCRFYNPAQHHKACKGQQSLSFWLKLWLYDTRSLTDKLARLIKGNIEVEVSYKGFTWANPTLIKLLRLRGRIPLFCREACLSYKGKPLVFAQTLVPTSHLRGSFKRLYACKDLSIGPILFKNAALTREILSVSPVSSADLIHFKACMPASKALCCAQAKWSRLSIFLTDQTAPVLISEFFLPELLKREPCCEHG